ncbi:MAG TPA: LamG-like jellyroll fold domain-containing protein, partial [Verrucomicrobiae bacterium]|nr:LamG-like jellyroll fold domain-containing protein [Verrucomicrobiae bacterium]
PAAASFSVTASGTAPLSYQWRRGGVNLGGATASSFTLNPTSQATDNGAQFSVVVSNAIGSVTSVVATLTVNAAGVAPTNQLALWLRADAGVALSGSAVSQWSDQSGNNRHALQATSASQPLLSNSALNGLPALRFDGVNDFLAFTLPINGLNGMSIFLVGANSQNQSGGGTHAEKAALFWNETAGWGTAYLTPFQSTVNMRFGTTQANNQILYSRPSSAGTAFTLTEAIKNGTTDTLYINGSNVVNQGGKFSSIAGCRDTANIGRGYNDNSFFAGDIAELLIYTRALGAGERTTVEQYLGAKYGLSVSAGGGGGGGGVSAAVQTELKARYEDGNVLIYWPLSCTACVLQQRLLLNKGEVWSDLDAPVIVRENQQCVVVPAGNLQRFYRLRLQ